jgi:hypothetical protein
VSDDAPQWGPGLKDQSITISGYFDQGYEAAHPLARYFDKHGMVQVTVINHLPASRLHALLWRLSRIRGLGWIPFRTYPVTRRVMVHRDNIEIWPTEEQK